jgi:beta-glucosidase
VLGWLRRSCISPQTHSKRARCCRYLSGEDPILGYILSQPAIKGIQSEGVIANAKHYIMNDQETNRGSVSEMVDERTRYQMYLPPFAGALDADVGSIMCSYNKINGQGNPTPIDGAKTGFKPGHWSCENPVTLKGDLKNNGAGGVRGKAWEGFVMSDWVSAAVSRVSQNCIASHCERKRSAGSCD